ncbi:MAG: ATPase [Desulfitibacter sp. BRH_c19]|nr:MAG: ATPase [Desulfitibacter sp. BRH_c19]
MNEDKHTNDHHQHDNHFEDKGVETKNGHGEHKNHHQHMLEEFKKRLLVCMVLTIPILILSPMIQQFLVFEISFHGDIYLLFTLASAVFFYGGWPFLRESVKELKKKEPGMMTLIALAITVSYVYSSVTVMGLPGDDFFWELATLIDIMLVGHWIEMRSVTGASNALEELVKLLPSKANLIKNNGEVVKVPIEEVEKGDHILVKPGEKVPIDGEIVKGHSTLDESLITGESIPVEKKAESKVIAGSINGDGSLTIKVEKLGHESYLSQVIELVKNAQKSKSKTQNLSDRAAKWLFYMALFAGITTLIVWLTVGAELPFAIERMVTVMIIACPHALGLAVPLVVAMSTTLSAKNGLLIRNRTNFENARNINAIVFDKTGTLTEGKFGITDIVLLDNNNEAELLKMAASIESHSQHPIAKGITQEAINRKIELVDPDEFKSITGKGLYGKIDDKKVHVVSPGYLQAENIAFSKEKYEKLAKQGKTVVFVIIDDKVSGMIALADQVRESAKETISELKKLGIKSIMLTGDNNQVAKWVGEELGIDEIFAEVLPDEKAKKIEEIKNEGYIVAMTGDGVNDAPALATADLGIAIGAGTDVAMETADVILVKSNPKDVLSLIKLSKATYKKMLQNLWWAAGYNIVAIPLAAGILYQYGVLLNPAIGAVLMSLSTVIVAVNAQLLRRTE